MITARDKFECAEREASEMALPCLSIEIRSGDVLLIDQVDAYLLEDHEWSARWYKGSSLRYIFRREGGRTIHLHREIVGLTDSDPRVADHISGDTLDNRRRNLRIATRAQNSWNIPRKAGRLYIGVDYVPYLGRWRASLSANYIRHASMHDSAAEAAFARDDMARRYHGEFAQLNFQTETIDTVWDKQTAIMEAIAADYRVLAEAEDAAGRLL